MTSELTIVSLPLLNNIHKFNYFMAKKNKQNKQTNKKPLTEEAYVKKFARTLPVEMCEMTYSNTNPHTVRVLVVRKEPTGLFTIGFYLIDSWCRGLYDTYCRAHVTKEQLDNILNIDKEYRKIVPMTYDEAHNYIFGAIEFGEEAGFEPPKEFNNSQYVLAEDTDDIPLISCDFGVNGKRVLECRTTDQFNRARNILERNLSPDQYMLMGVTGFEEDDDDDDSDELDIDDIDFDELAKSLPTKQRHIAKMMKINSDNFEALDDAKFMLSISVINMLFETICDNEDKDGEEIPAEIASFYDLYQKALEDTDDEDIFSESVDAFYEAVDASRYEFLSMLSHYKPIDNDEDSDKINYYLTFFFVSAVVYTEVAKLKKKEVESIVSKSDHNVDEYQSFTKKCLDAYLGLNNG